jgi:hypothetical protein
MKWNVNRVFSKGLRRMAIAMAVAGSVAASTAYANPVLYIELNQGAELAIVDVTDPGHVKGDAVMDLHQDQAPALKPVPGLALAGSTMPLRVVDLKQVREEISKSDTDTTFLLTDGGLYLIRRPAVEMPNKARERDVELGIAGAG